jgi:hypothetical protein
VVLGAFTLPLPSKYSVLKLNERSFYRVHAYMCTCLSFVNCVCKHRSDLTTLLGDGGAVVCDTVANLKSTEHRSMRIVVCSALQHIEASVREAAEQCGACFVRFEWVMDCISNYSLLPPDSSQYSHAGTQAHNAL